MDDLVFKNKIDILFDNKEFEEAIKLLKEAEANGDDSSWILCNIGWGLGRLERREEALEYLRRVEVREEPDEEGWLNSEIGWNLGLMESRLTRMELLSLMYLLISPMIIGTA